MGSFVTLTPVRSFRLCELYDHTFDCDAYAPLTRASHARRSSRRLHVAAADFTSAMMRAGRGKPRGQEIGWTGADALRLPYPGDRFDAWFQAPASASVKAIRVEFTTRLYFAQRLHPEAVSTLIEAQAAEVRAALVAPEVRTVLAELLVDVVDVEIGARPRHARAAPAGATASASPCARCSRRARG